MAAQKEQQSAAAASESVYDKLRMFNGQAGGWAWYPGAPPPTHPALTLPHGHVPTTPIPSGGHHLIRDDPHKRGQFIFIFSSSITKLFFFLEIPSYRLACGLSLYLHIYGCLLIMQKGSKLARQSTATMTDRLVFSCMFSNGGQSVYSFFFVCVFFFCLCVCAVACVREVVFVCLLPTEWASKAGSPLYDVARYNRFTEAYNPP